MRIDEELLAELEELNSITAKLYGIAYGIDCFVGDEETSITIQYLEEIRRDYGRIARCIVMGEEQIDRIVKLMREKRHEDKQ